MLTYCRTNNIYINATAPYKHQHNFIECFVGAIKNGVRVALLYNKAPFYLWYHAMVYYIHTYNQVPRRNETRSKDEHFYGIKPDVGINVPFYAVGYAHRPKEIRTDKVYSLRADKCRFIGSEQLQVTYNTASADLSTATTDHTSTTTVRSIIILLLLVLLQVARWS